jgi:hypothetical protein
LHQGFSTLTTGSCSSLPCSCTMITSPSRRPNRGARRALALVAAGLAHVAGPARPGWRRALPRRRRRRKRAPTAQTVRGGAQERAGPCRAWGRRADGGACPRCRPWILRVAGGGGAADGGIYMGGRRCGSGRGILQSRGNRPQRAPAVVGSGGVQVRTQGWRLARPWRGGGGGGGAGGRANTGRAAPPNLRSAREEW